MTKINRFLDLLHVCKEIVAPVNIRPTTFSENSCLNNQASFPPASLFNSRFLSNIMHCFHYVYLFVAFCFTLGVVYAASGL